jgi:cytochrome c
MRAVAGAFAAAGLTLLLAGCGKPSTSSGGEAAAPPPPTAAEKAATLATLPVPYNAADLANGEAKFALCKSCHTLTPGGANMTGPNLYGVFGRQAAAAPDFSYSDALKKAGFIWEFHHLDAWLADPKGYMPGTKMTFVGLRDAKDRTDVIAYIAAESRYKPTAP